MALTIRKLTPMAKSAIQNVIDTEPHINTKTKAIDFILSSYNINSLEIRELTKENYHLKTTYSNLLHKHNSILCALKTIKKFL